MFKKPNGSQNENTLSNINTDRSVTNNMFFFVNGFHLIFVFSFVTSQGI